jgi:hypothetical protein
MSFPEWTFDLTTSGRWYLDSIKTLCRIPWDPGIGRIVLGTDGNKANNLDLVCETRRWLEPGGFTEEQFDRMFHHNGLRLLGEE